MNILMYGQSGFGKKSSIYLNTQLYEKKHSENLIVIYLNAMVPIVSLTFLRSTTMTPTL